jgi:hypothetical protein
MKSLCLIAAILLAGAPPAAAEKKELQTIDAFGRNFDVRLQTFQVLLGKLGSAESANFALGLYEEIPEFWSQILPGSEPDVACSHEYRKKHPERSLEDYQAFLQTEAGATSYVSCVVRIFSEGPDAPRFLNAYLASIVANQTLPFFDGLGPVEKLEMTPELRERLRQNLKELIAWIECGVREAAKKVALADLVRDPAVLRPLLDQVLPAGACKSLAPLGADAQPEPDLAAPAAADAGNLPQDAFGRSVDVRAQFLGHLIGTLGKDEWANFALGLLETTEVWPRYLRTAELEVLYSYEYRRKLPDKSVEEYEAFRATAAGAEMEQAFFVKLLTSGPQSEQNLEAHLAAFELGAIVPFFQQLGPPAKLELTAENRAAIGQVLFLTLGSGKCLLREAVKEIGIESVLRDPALVGPAWEKAAASGVCERPEAPGRQ